MLSGVINKLLIFSLQVISLIFFTFMTYQISIINYKIIILMRKKIIKSTKK